MLRKEATVKRPERWDVPFGNEMSQADVERLVSIDPFSKMDPTRFSRSCSLHNILRNDARIVRVREGDIIVREGDYGNSAFLVLTGKVRIALSSLPDEILGRQTRKPKGLLRAIAQLWTNPSLPEVRKSAAAKTDDTDETGQRTDGETTRIFLQDVPGILDEHRTILLGEGQIFGELAALARTARTATAFAALGNAELLEIRWQGLRELMKRDPALQKHIHQLYRENSLATHLRETPLLENISHEYIDRIVAETQFETHGNFEWFRPFKSSDRSDISKRIAEEPVIVEEGDYVDGLILIRSGFARVSRRYGNGHRTISYIGKGDVFGFSELTYNWKNDERLPSQLSLRALGYVDILRIPTQLVDEAILPQLSKQKIRQLCEDAKKWMDNDSRESVERLAKTRTEREIQPGLHEFLGQHQFINGKQAMLIDLDRCTRCDDCVRACASTHENNPRFLREGPKYGNQMVASACMHCADPVCMIGCPTGAIGRDDRSGNVLINDLTCIGCTTCANSCPYNNIRMVEIRDSKGQFMIGEETQKPIMKATKCDLCTDQLGGPACQRACPHDALVRIDLSDTQKLVQWTQR